MEGSYCYLERRYWVFSLRGVVVDESWRETVSVWAVAKVKNLKVK